MNSPARRPRPRYTPASKWVSCQVPGTPCTAEARRSSDRFRVSLKAEDGKALIAIEFNSSGQVELLRNQETVPFWNLSFVVTAARQVLAAGGANWIRENASTESQKEETP